MAGGAGRRPRPGDPTVVDRLGLRTPPRRHVWVKGPDDDPCPHAGLLIAWRRGGSDWHAWVVYARSDDADLLVQTWVPASSLRPAT